MVRATKDEKDYWINGQHAANLKCHQSPSSLTLLAKDLLHRHPPYMNFPAIDFTFKTIAINWLDGSEPADIQEPCSGLEF